MLTTLVLACWLTVTPAVPGSDPVPAFVENRGQWPEHVAFAARARGERHALLLRAEKGALVFDVNERAGGTRVVARAEFEDGDGWTPTAEGEREERHHVYVGNDPAAWIRGIRAFDRLVYRDEHGIERARVQFTERGIELRPIGGGEPRLRWRGDDALASIGFTPRADADAADAAHSVVDVGLAWSTYLGGALGNAENLEDVRVCNAAAPRVLVVGHSNADDFPVTSGVHAAPHVGYRATVTCFDIQSGAVSWSATLGGEKIDRAMAVDVDAWGAVHVVGDTTSKTFPVTPGAHQTVYDDFTVRGSRPKLALDGSELAYSTYLGGAGPAAGTLANDVRVRADGAAIVVGSTGSAQFPVTVGAIQSGPPVSTDAFVSVLRPDGSGFEWSTLLGSTHSDSAAAVSLELDGAITVAGRTGAAGSFPKTPGALQWNVPPTAGSPVQALFVTRLEPDGTALRWSALVAWQNGNDPALALATGADGRAVVAGQTWAAWVPVTPGAFQPHYGGNRDGFVFVLSPDGTQFLGASFLGGEHHEALLSVAVDDSGVITAGGWAIPPTPWLTEPIVTPVAPVIGAAAIYRFAPDLSSVISGHVFGGAQGLKSNSLTAIAVLPQGDVIAAGTTLTPDFPTTPGAFQPDAPGGQWDGIVARHRMLPSGVDRTGRSGPTCASGAYLAASGPSQAGNAGFTLYSSNLPPAATGWLALGLTAPSPIALGGGFALHVDPLGPHVLLPWDANGTGHAAMSLTLPAQAAGLELAAQLVLLAPQCPGGLAWTHALRLIVSP